MDMPLCSSYAYRAGFFQAVEAISIDRHPNCEVESQVPSQPLTRKRLEETLADIRSLSSLAGQLACLVSYRDPNSGHYSLPSVLERSVSSDEDRQLRLLHEAIFHRWLKLPLQDQKIDLDVYLSTLPYDRSTVIRTWSKLESYRCFVPATASVAERQLFLSNMEILLRIAMAEIGGGEPDDPQPPSGLAMLAIKEASAMLRVPARTLRLWAELGEIPAVKVGRQWRFRRRDIEEWLARQNEPRKNR